MEQDRIEWNRMEKNGKGWNAMEQDEIEWNRMNYNGIG